MLLGKAKDIRTCISLVWYTYNIMGYTYPINKMRRPTIILQVVMQLAMCVTPGVTSWSRATPNKCKMDQFSSIPQLHTMPYYVLKCFWQYAYDQWSWKSLSTITERWFFAFCSIFHLEYHTSNPYVDSVFITLQTRTISSVACASVVV